MKYITTFSRDVPVSQVALGCMRISSMTAAECERYISHALDCGYNYFDHADIYGGGKCEEVFAGGIKSLGIGRDKIILQSKCGIVPGKMYDFSESHILQSVDGILKRLETNYLDVLILHRPDVLFDGEVDAVTLPGQKGSFTVLNNHASIVSSLVAGNIVYDVAGEKKSIAVDGGLVDVDKNVVSVCIY